MSNKYHLAALRKVAILERKLDAAERKLEKQRQKYWKKAYKLGYVKSRESTWEANFKLAVEFRKQLQIPTKNRDYWISQAKYYIAEAWLARTFDTDKYL